VRVRRAALAASCATTVAGTATLLNRLGELPLSSVASSPQAVGDGRVWLVATSGLIADRPLVPSLLGFWIVGFAALILCSVRVVALVAVAGHICSALAVYALIGLTRLVDPEGFASVVQLADYGLSAIIGAWIGAIAAVLWRRTATRRAHLAIALGSLGCAGIGLACRPDVTFLDSEHIVAFAIGAALASERVRARLALPPRRLAAALAFGWSATMRGW
jgi:hypothetical protein